MAMIQKDIKQRFSSNHGSSGYSFEKHSGRMGAFYKSHTSVPLVNAARRDRPALPKGMRHLYVNHITGKTGGTRSPGSTEAWLTLMLMWKLTPRKFSQN